MKKELILTSVFIAFTVTTILAQITMSGINEAQFIYRDAPDSLSNYFHNEANLKMNYRNIEFGMSFTADLPYYNQFEPVKDLHPGMVDYRWDRYYLQANLQNMTLRAGSFTDFFGNGIILRSYRDKTFDWDTRLNGLSTQMQSDYANVKALYAALPSETNQDKNDVVSGIDVSSTYVNHLNLGLSFLSSQERRFDDRYRTRLVGGGRAELFYSMFDLSAEYAEMKLYRSIGGEIRGKALYAYANTYLGALTISSGYKNYENFDYRLNDLPTLNSSEEPLSERFEPGYDEEGLLGKMQFSPDFTTSIAATYSEAWNSNFTIRQSDLFVEGSKDFETFILGIEYAQLESIDKVREEWFQEIIPAVSFDLNMFRKAAYIRGQYKVKSTKKGQIEDTVYNPLIQYDIFFDKFSVSLSAETQLDNYNEIPDNPPFWLGAELTLKVFSHTDIKAFVGEERGGKVCRSGQCFYTSPFKGMKLDITTRF